MNNKTVLIVIPSLAGGGAEKVTRMIATLLHEHRVLVTIAVFHYSIEHHQLLPEAINIVNLGKRNRFDVRHLIAFRHIVKAIDPDVILSFLDVTNIFSWIATFGIAKNRLIMNERSYPFTHLPHKRFAAIKLLLLKLAYRNCKLVISNSLATQRALAKEFKLKSHKNITLYNPVEITPAEQLAYNRSGFKQATHTQFIAVGRLSREKDYPTLLKAVDHLVNVLGHTHFSVKIVGEGAELNTLIAMSKRLTIDKYVEFCGYQSDVSASLSAADVYLLTSMTEGFPNSLLEAMNHGLAVISTDCLSGPGELITHSVNGFLVPVAAHQELGCKMAFYMKNKSVSIEHAHNARRRSMDFSTDIFAKRLLSILAIPH